MPHPTSRLPLEPNSGQVLTRFFLRLIILAAFATFGAQGFARTLASLLVVAEIFCLVTAAFRREALLGPVLTHWDEAAAYALAYGVVTRLS
jgi:hypothetical protein